jgi:hypothetical protein
MVSDNHWREPGCVNGDRIESATEHQQLDWFSRRRGEIACNSHSGPRARSDACSIVFGDD